MSNNLLQRRLLIEGLSQASGTVLWGKLRHLQASEHDDVTPLAHTLKEGGRARSRKARD